VDRDFYRKLIKNREESLVSLQSLNSPSIEQASPK
jgi:hypothetical protein